MVGPGDLDRAAVRGVRRRRRRLRLVVPAVLGGRAAPVAGSLVVRQLVQALGEALGAAAVVDEDDRRGVLADELQELRVDRRPDRARGWRRVEQASIGPGRCAPASRPPVAGRSSARRRRRSARSCPRPGRRSRGRAPSACRRRRSRTCAAGRRGTARSAPAGAGWPRARSAGGPAPPLVGRRRCESRSRVSARWAPRFDWATAWISSTITASTPVEDLPRARGHHQVERLRGRDQDVGRLAPHRLALALRRVAGAQADRDLRADPLQRRAEVALDVVGERLQRRDVDDPHALARAARARERGGRSPRGRRPASCPTRWGRRSACWRRRRSSASPAPAQASAPRTTPRTSASRAR